MLACAFALATVVGLQTVADARAGLRAASPAAALLGWTGGSGPEVVFVFQPADCLGSGDLVRRWNALRSDPRFRVRGMVVGDGRLSSRQQRFFAEARIRIPVRGIRMRDAALVGANFGYARTPFAVVLDDAGRAVASFPAEQNVPADVVHALISSR